MGGLALDALGLEPTVLGAMYVGTIHSYCQKILGIIDARYRQFDVLDGNRLLLYIMSRYPALGVQRVRLSRQERSYFKAVRQTGRAWSMMNDEMVGVEEVAAADAVLGEVLGLLRQRLDVDQFIDFSLMIRLVVEALEGSHPAAVAAVSDLEHLMVDEYQDVNTSQERLINALHRNSRTLFVVGDDDQAIYGWRGADVTNILSFGDRNPDASSHTLATNFRSTNAVVRTADALAAAELGAHRIAKNPHADELPGPRDYRVLWFQDRPSEAEWVASRIERLLATEYTERDGKRRGLTQGDFAILMRSTREPEQDGRPRHAAFTEALRAHGIHVSLEAGGSPFDVPQVQVLRQTFELLRERSPAREVLREHFETAVLPAYPRADFGALASVMAQWGREIHTPPGGVRRRVFPQNLVHELLRKH